MNGTTEHGSLRLVEALLGRREEEEDVAVYRKHTVALLRRYFRVALDLGRVPSMLGGQMFRARVTSYKSHTFEEIAIFVHDMERCLEKLSPSLLQMLAATVLVEYPIQEAARVLGMTERHAKRLYPEAVDELSRVLLKKGLLEQIGALVRSRDDGDDGLPPKKPVKSWRPARSMGEVRMR